jgi:hypothetical protein
MAAATGPTRANSCATHAFGTTAIHDSAPVIASRIANGTMVMARPTANGSDTTEPASAGSSSPASNSADAGE